MRRAPNKSHCPVNVALEVIGDDWSLLIVRDIVFWGKHTFREFLASEEGIASNILSARLATLEKQGIIAKKSHATDKRKTIYSLTEKGLDLIPLLLEMSAWSARHDPETTAPLTFVTAVESNRERMFGLIRQTIQSGGTMLSGPDSVISMYERT